MTYFTRSLSYLKPYWKLAIVSMAILLFSTVTGLLEPWPLKFLFDQVLGHQPLPQWIADLIGPLGEDRVHFLILAVTIGLLITFLTNGLAVLDSYVNTKIRLWMSLDFRSDLFQHVQRLSLTYHDQSRSGMVIYLINYQADAASALIMAVPPMVHSIFMIGGMFAIIYQMDPFLATLSLAVVPALYYSVNHYVKHIQSRLYEVKILEGDSLSIIHEAISMLRVIVAFGQERHEYQRFRDQGEVAVDARVKVTVRQMLFSLAVNMTTATGTALVLGFGAYHAMQGKLTGGQLLVIMSYLASVYKPLETISTTIGGLQDQIVSLKISFDLLDTLPEIRDSPHAIDIDRVQGTIAFENIGFSYTGREDTLQSVSFEAKFGQVVALVGPTGAGKTTLISLIPRFYEPQYGRILLDGRDIRDISLRSLRKQISLVLQEPLLFSGSIADNIRYGRLDATLEEVQEAARSANAHDFIMRLPEQYDTLIGERGAQLSGGERQRISVARAFLKDAPILILDEPTSSIDSKTEEVILEALERLMVGRTTLMVAHRLSTIRMADHILVLNNGELVEQGPHEELLANDGLYRLLYNIQTQGGRQSLLPGTETQISGTVSDELALNSNGHEPPGPPERAGTVVVPAGLVRDAVPADHEGSPHPLPAETAFANAPAVEFAPASQNRIESRLSPIEFNYMPQKKKIVVLGMMSRHPVAGVVWQVIHYLVGLQRLGYDAYYVEAGGHQPCSTLAQDDQEDRSHGAAQFINSVMQAFDLGNSWAFHALHSDGACYGLSESALKELYSTADLIINLHGATFPLPEHSQTERLVYLETDPVLLQIELHQNLKETVEFLEPHVAFFTFGENYGNPDCLLPVSDRFQFHPTRQPIVLDFWRPQEQAPRHPFTTIGNWQQHWREVHYEGDTYQWSKHLEFQKFWELPGLTDEKFELSLSRCPEEDQELLRAKGWSVKDALSFTYDIYDYRKYIMHSKGEFTVAKDQNVRLRSGWFSDRSASYLAAGRPVITQETGFSGIIPTGNGLFAFSTLQEIMEAVDAINADYEHHSRSAYGIAQDYFSSEVVLRRLLSEVGV